MGGIQVSNYVFQGPTNNIGIFVVHLICWKNKCWEDQRDGGYKCWEEKNVGTKKSDGG